jgi:hypothetical protein
MLGNPERPVGGLAVRTPPGVELVPLGRDDLADAARLAREARGLRPSVDLEAERDRWETLVNSPDTVAYLARDAGEPTGLAIMELGSWV